MIFQRETWWYVCFFLIFFVCEMRKLQNSMKTTFQKSQTLEQIIRNIPGAIIMYHDHRKGNKSRKQ